jgi:anthranilate/para-aminobenzoate synthase component I
MEAQMIATFETDSVSILVTVTDESTGSALNLTGGSVEAVAKSRTTTIEATASIVSAEAGTIRVSFSPDTFDQGVWQIQVRVTLGDEVQTVVSRTITVSGSIRAVA